jgi:hypothetical protein
LICDSDPLIAFCLCPFGFSCGIFMLLVSFQLSHL